MQNLNLNLGMQSFVLQEGCPPLRFRPDDPSVAGRLEELSAKLTQICDQANAEKENSSEGVSEVSILRKYDLKAKDLFADAFGRHNDFEAILGGISLLNETDGVSNAEIVLNALVPIIETGAEEYSTRFADDAAAQAELNREQRRALNNG